MQHKNLTIEKWQKFTLMEQLSHIGSEIERTIKWKEKRNNSYSKQAFYRALELIDLTLQTPLAYHRLKEIARAREVFCDAVLGGKEYHSSLEDLDRYFLEFALAARLHI